MKQALSGGRASALLIVSFLFVLAIPGDTQNIDIIRGFEPPSVAAERQLEQKLQSIPDPGHAEANLRHLTSEPHMAGTESSHRVAEWLLGQYRSFGFDAEIVTYSAWLPQPREMKLELTAPERKALASPEQPVAADADTFDKRIALGFNAYSPSGDVTAPVVYVNYGTQDDYRQLESLGINIEGRIVIARYGRGFRGIKTKLAEEHRAAGLIIYSDPEDDGYVVGDAYPRGPWRPVSGIQRGSVLYTQLYPGDPLLPGIASTSVLSPDTHRLAPAEARSLSHIPTMPISAQAASVILANLGGRQVPRGWQGGLPFTYHVGPGDAKAHMKVVMDYAQRPIYDVIARLHGTSDGEWVILGNHHDAWVFGAADPGSGTSAMLEAARALGELVRSGWKPRRTILMCEWDAEEPGLIGSTMWVEANRSELQAKAVAYVNTDVGVTGPNFSASATPSLKDFVRDATRQVEDPETGRSIYEAWRGHVTRAEQEASGIARQAPKSEASGQSPLGDLGAGSAFCPFFDYAGIPSIDMSFGGDYGVYHSLYDDFYWMKHFGDPSFAYHAALARVLGVLALRLDEADILPFDYSAYASEIGRAESDLASRTADEAPPGAIMRYLAEASAQLMGSAVRESQALRAIGVESLDPAPQGEINHSLVDVEQALLKPGGLSGRPWFKHTVYAPGSYAGYAAEVLPGVAESLYRNDAATLRIEADALIAALRRAAARLDEVAGLAKQAASAPVAGH